LYGGSGSQAYADNDAALEASYSNLPEARAAVQALHAIMTAGACGAAKDAVWQQLARHGAGVFRTHSTHAA
jgi:hypothetical protein